MVESKSLHLAQDTWTNLGVGKVVIAGRARYSVGKEEGEGLHQKGKSKHKGCGPQGKETVDKK